MNWYLNFALYDIFWLKVSQYVTKTVLIKQIIIEIKIRIKWC